TRPYDDAVERARAAMRDGTLKAVLWHQGESDSNEAAAPRYEERLAGLVQRLRRDLGSPDLPFLVGGLPRFEGRSYPPARDIVDRAHRALPSRLPRVTFVSAEGLEHK